MTDKAHEAVVAALAPLCPDCHGDGWYADTETCEDEHGIYPEQVQVQCDHPETLGRLTPEARDMLLLGFAVAELEPRGTWSISRTIAWNYVLVRIEERGEPTIYGSGPTPLAAVNAALEALSDA